MNGMRKWMNFASAAVWLVLLAGGTANAVTFSAEPSGLRIDRTIEVDKSLDDVWRMWTTKEGVQSFFAPQAMVELKPGGAYEMHFNPAAPEGKKGSEGTIVIAYVPKELLVFSWNAPGTFGKLRDEHTWVALRFESLAPAKTRIRFTHYGFGQGEEWAKVHAYFERAWGFVLGNFSKAAAKQ
jgi:uncharacterized protein YndB with AHSA1/START domain